jgi:hypothetical protein
LPNFYPDGASGLQFEQFLSGLGIWHQKFAIFVKISAIFPCWPTTHFDAPEARKSQTTRIQQFVMVQWLTARSQPQIVVFRLQRSILRSCEEILSGKASGPEALASLNLPQLAQFLSGNPPLTFCKICEKSTRTDLWHFKNFRQFLSGFCNGI